MKIKIFNREKLVSFCSDLKPSVVVAILLAGDRNFCCDEGVALEIDGDVVGVATIAPFGEMLSGIPTIVALYVLPSHRGHGYSKQLLEAVIGRCLERGFFKTRIEVMSGRLMKVVRALPDELKVALDIIDCGDVMDFMSDGENKI